jgi:signal transduction histidine kinase
MFSSRLSWRIALPFAAFVLVGSVVLALWMSWVSVKAEHARLETLADSSARLIRRMRLPPSERMAQELAEVLHVEVLFLRGEEFVPRSPVWTHPKTARAIQHEVSPEGITQNAGFQHEAIKIPLMDDWHLVLWREQLWPWSRIMNKETLLALTIFWALAMVLGMLVVRSLVRPLRYLAAKLPDIEKPEAFELLEVGRNDEIGDLARSFMRTREALQSERSQRQQSERLAVLGRMTTALAHEIQNPVSAIKMHAQLMSADAENAEEASANIIASEAGRIESLVNQWMFLSKPEPPVLVPVEIGKVLRQTLQAHEPQLLHAQVASQLVPIGIDQKGLMMVMGDAKRLSQVFSNLVMNAIQAMPSGGRLLVRVEMTPLHLEVEFTDTGHGFSTEALERCSEFFFSEKEGGMGIGLSVSTEIVKAHQGSLQVRNCQEGGASVTVRLPRHQS